MTPKEKAELLIAKYQFNVYKKAFQNTDLIIDRYYCIDNDMAKQCALIAIDFMIEIANQKDDNDRYYYFDLSEFDIDYLNKIKAEINAL